ncbi:hypothetical protein XENOCAPTIV_005550 [Xenoophorus captivus]|uniref:TNF receptor-associated factor n=1 Tax=Xenoophorus captivus TaxID=1517983 RepID=A0ABV0QYQ6_9TELE
MAFFESNKGSLEEDSYEGAVGGELSGCALAMLEKEKESPLSPSESPSTLINSSSLQGYDVEFDPPLESKYECPICLMALRNAIQTRCGHRFCKSCIEKSIRLNGTSPKPLRTLGPSISSEDIGAAASMPTCGGLRAAVSCSPAACQPSEVMQMLREMDGRLVKQNHQLLELIISQETQAGHLAELRRRVSMLEETMKELEAQQCHGIFIWRLKGFSALMRNQEAGLPVVEHSPGFYTGRPGYKLCLRLHLQTPNAPRCSNYISLFVHTMQGAFDGQLTWPFQGTIRLAIIDQGPESQHHMEVMETKPDLQAFQKPINPRNPKGFGYVTFMHLQQLNQRAYIKDDTLLIRCEVTPRFDSSFHREGPVVQPRGPEASLSRE